MTEREQLLAMLAHATVLGAEKGWRTLCVDEDPGKVLVSTGPDDAIAVFRFDDAGRLQTVSVDES